MNFKICNEIFIQFIPVANEIMEYHMWFVTFCIREMDTYKLFLFIDWYDFTLSSAFWLWSWNFNVFFTCQVNVHVHLNFIILISCSRIICSSRYIRFKTFIILNCQLTFSLLASNILFRLITLINITDFNLWKINDLVAIYAFLLLLRINWF